MEISGTTQSAANLENPVIQPLGNDNAQTLAHDMYISIAEDGKYRCATDATELVQ
jgi:hypothetical protein